MGEFFVDRVELKQELFNLLNDMQFHNIVYILSSRSGLGKSAFSRQIVNQIKDRYPAINVSIPVGDNISIDEGFYIREIAKVLSDHSKDFEFESLNDFLRTTSNPMIKKIWTHKLIKDAESLNGFVKPINSMLSYFDKTGELSENGLLGVDNAKYTYIILNEYIAYICNNETKIIINVENVQQMDRVSLMQIRDLLKKVDNVFFLFEYTLSTDSLEEAKKFEQNFCINYTNVITRRLKKLNYRYTCELLNHICPKQSSLLSENTLKEIYFTIDGNIRQLSDIENIFEIGQEETFLDTTENFTSQRLKSLNNAHQIQLLCLVYAHMSQVSNEIIKLLLSNKAYILFVRFETILSELIGDSGLLEFNSSTNTLKLKHDSIRAEMKTIPKFEAKISLSYSWWIDFYENSLSECDVKDWTKTREIVRKLCYFYCYYEPAANKILSILPHIRMIAINSVNPDEAISFLTGFYDIFKKINNSEYLYKFNKFLLNLYYELGIFDKAYSVFKNTSFRSEKSQQLYRVMLLDRLQRENEAIQMIDLELKNTSNERYMLILYLIKMIAAASINQYDECLNIFEYIYSKKDVYSKYFEYGFFLRNSEIVLSLREAIPYLEESIKFFYERNESIYEAHARISMLMNCSRAGIFDEAKKQLEIIKKLLKYNSLERHIVLNDEVAFEMCRGNYDKNLENELKLAMCTAEVVFDKIIINHNLLILYKKNKQFLEGSQIVEYLLELLDLETNKLNICFTYWNISFFYKEYDEVQYNFYYNKYSMLYSDLISKPIRKSVIETDVSHKPNMEYVIGFISHWRFPLPEDL